jgi:hypothetical protein
MIAIYAMNNKKINMDVIRSGRRNFLNTCLTGSIPLLFQPGSEIDTLIHRDNYIQISKKG